MRYEYYSPALLPSYLFQGRVLAWECSACRKVFSLTVDEAGRIGVTTPPAHIEREFRMHDCEIVFVLRAHHV